MQIEAGADSPCPASIKFFIFAIVPSAAADGKPLQSMQDAATHVIMFAHLSKACSAFSAYAEPPAP